MDDSNISKWLKRITIFSGIVGFALCVISAYVRDSKSERGLLIAGLSLFGVAIVLGFVLGVINCITLIREFKKEKDNQQQIYEQDKSAWEEDSKDFINQTAYGAEHKMRMAVRSAFQFSEVQKAHKYLSKTSKILGGIMITLAILLMVCIVPLLVTGHTVAGLIVLGSFFALFISSAIINAVIEKVSISRGRKYENEKIKYGKLSGYQEKYAKVIVCCVSSEGSFSTGGKASPYYNERTKILSTTYRVIVDVDGEPKTAFSKTPYNEGDTVKVVTKDNVKWASIIQDDGYTDMVI